MGSFFPVAFTRAAGLRPLTSRVHDEVLPRDQGKGRNEEDHWSIWSHWETAGQWGSAEGWMWGTVPDNWEIVAVRSGNAVAGVPGGLGAIPKVSSFFF